MLVYSLLGNSQKLDGGAMYGNVPKALWSQWSPCDDLNRVFLSCRALLVKKESRLILLETGIGLFFPPLLRERFGVEEKEHILLKSLAELGFSPHDITDVVLSHLHFDHAGGCLRPYQEGSPLELVFSRARYFVGEESFARAKRPHLRDRASFIPELPGLLEKTEKLTLISKNRRKGEDYGLPQEISFRFSDGHTPGLMLAQVSGKEKSLIFVSDLIPGTNWVHSAVTMGYDRFPEKLIDEKIELLEECVREKTYLFFTHDPEYAMARVQKDEKGKFTFSQACKMLKGEEI